MMEKVAAYITWGGRLLVFREPRHPEAGVQIPGGTVEEGEPPGEAVLREATEESGLTGLRVKRYLGSGIYDFRHLGYGVFRRHFYHIEFLGEAPDRWIGHEEAPSDGTPSPIELEFYWIDLADGGACLAGEQGDFISEICLR